MPKPALTLVCPRNHQLEMHFAPDPPCIRGRSLYCDRCRKYIPDNWDEGYFICGGECNYDVCRECGMKAGGVDPDIELLKRKGSKVPRLLSQKSISQAAQKIAEFEKTLNSVLDEDKRLTTQYALMIENIKIELANAMEAKKKEVKGQTYTDTSLLRIILVMD